MRTLTLASALMLIMGGIAGSVTCYATGNPFISPVSKYVTNRVAQSDANVTPTKGKLERLAKGQRADIRSTVSQIRKLKLAEDDAKSKAEEARQDVVNEHRRAEEANTERVKAEKNVIYLDLLRNLTYFANTYVDEWTDRSFKYLNSIIETQNSINVMLNGAIQQIDQSIETTVTACLSTVKARLLEASRTISGKVKDIINEAKPEVVDRANGVHEDRRQRDAALDNLKVAVFGKLDEYFSTLKIRDVIAESLKDGLVDLLQRDDIEIILPEVEQTLSGASAADSAPAVSGGESPAPEPLTTDASSTGAEDNSEPSGVESLLQGLSEV